VPASSNSFTPTIKINTRTDKEQTLEDKVASVKALL
jgi:uncharacterized protein YqgV (UPF0045/DUF77 family)